MTENNYDKLKDAICELVNIAEDATSREVFEILDNAGVDVIDCLDKLSGYEAIGTIDEFKALKENSNGYSKEDIELNRKAMYNKAIDDFASKLIMHFADWELSNVPFNDDETDGIGEIICETIENAIGGVEEIAEQLKESAFFPYIETETGQMIYEQLEEKQFLLEG